MIILKKIKKLLKILTKVTWLKGLRYGVAANIELEDLIKDIKFNTVIDVGSNRGQFILLVKGFFKKITFHSFEPIIEILNIQKETLKDFDNIFFYNFALGDIKTEKELNILNKPDSSSFLEVNKKSNLRIKNNSDFNLKEKRLIKIFTVNEIFQKLECAKPILMKIDVQGFELDVIKGCGEFLKEIKYILLEVTYGDLYSIQPKSDQVIDFLNDKNFKIINKNKKSKIPYTDIYQQDLLFENEMV